VFIKCENCSKEISDAWPACTHCGRLREEQHRHNAFLRKQQKPLEVQPKELQKSWAGPPLVFSAPSRSNNAAQKAGEEPRRHQDASTTESKQKLQLPEPVNPQTAVAPSQLGQTPRPDSLAVPFVGKVATVCIVLAIVVAILACLFQDLWLSFVLVYFAAFVILVLTAGVFRVIDHMYRLSPVPNKVEEYGGALCVACVLVLVVGFPFLLFGLRKSPEDAAKAAHKSEVEWERARQQRELQKALHEAQISHEAKYGK
jgi:uncharacterized membrane protein YqjE